MKKIKNFKISNKITENMDFYKDPDHPLCWDNKTGGGVFNYLDYLNDNTNSKKNKGRKGLSTEFIQVDPEIENTKDLKKYLLDAGKKLPKPQKYSHQRQNCPIKEIVSTLNIDEGHKNFKKIFNDWVQNEIKFLQNQGFKVLAVYHHKGEALNGVHWPKQIDPK